jgi:DNA-binding NarL/FixJ family response regulator
LIIADIMMPEMNGYQFYQRVRQSQERLLIPFIFLSAKGEAEDIRFGKELGVDDYLMKPVRPEDLIATILGKLKRFEEMGTIHAQKNGSLDHELQRDGFGSDLPDALTPKELEVLRHMTLGMTNLDIAEAMFVELSTVKTHVSNILSKLGVANRVEAVSLALRSTAGSNPEE